MVKSSKARIMATNTYNDKAYDNIAVRLKRGTRDRFKAAASSIDMSLAGLVSTSVEKYIAENAPDYTPEKWQKTNDTAQ